VLREGEQAYCALSWAEELAGPGDVAEAEARIGATVRYWRHWLGRARIPDHPWRDPIQRSALAIKGLTYMPTGATVAALTTSLPETPGGERNWDYRYCWMRDTTFTLQALHYLNLDWEADEFMQFVADVEPNEDGAMQIMYGIDGRRDLTESTSTICPAIPPRGPCESATARSTSGRTTSSAPFSTRSTSTHGGANASPVGCGRS
jgi:alpha,alpha-trehalase